MSTVVKDADNRTVDAQGQRRWNRTGRSTLTQQVSELDSVRETLRGPSERLPDYVRADASRRLGHDFGQVQVHTDAQAAASATALGAKAYTLGSHIVFGPGLYQPRSADGRALLLHELTHVAQQRDARPSDARAVSSANDDLEREAHNASRHGSHEISRTPAIVARDVGTSANALVPASPVGASHRFRIVVKSFIRVIGSAIGTLPWLPSPTLLVDPFAGPLSTPTGRLAALAAATDLQFHETAPTDTRDNLYRLYSARDFTVTGGAGVPLAVHASPIDTDNGHEGPLETPPLTLYDRADRGGATAPLHFSWSAKGRPNLLAEPVFQAVFPRLSRYIWHHVEGDVDASGIRITGFGGSRFPTHRLYIDGSINRTIPQGNFNALWQSGSPIDSVA